MSEQSNPRSRSRRSSVVGEPTLPSWAAHALLHLYAEVHAGSSVGEVSAGAAVENVVATGTDQPVIALHAGEVVAAAVTLQEVAESGAEDRLDAGHVIGAPTGRLMAAEINVDRRRTMHVESQRRDLDHPRARRLPVLRPRCRYPDRP